MFIMGGGYRVYFIGLKLVIDQSKNLRENSLKWKWRLVKGQWIAQSAKYKKLRYKRVKRVLYSFIKQNFNTGAELNPNPSPTSSPT